MQCLTPKTWSISDCNVWIIAKVISDSKETYGSKDHPDVDELHKRATSIDKKISILSRGLKQDLILNTEINDENKIHIDGQLVGELKGLKFLIEVSSKTLDTDIKSIKKAARKGVEKELVKRVEEIFTKDFGKEMCLVFLADHNSAPEKFFNNDQIFRNLKPYFLKT